MEHFETFIELCNTFRRADHRTDKQGVASEDKIILKIQNESKRLICADVDLSKLLISDDEYVRFWSAMGCIENRSSEDLAIKTLEELIQIGAAYPIVFRASVIVPLYKSGELYDLI